MYAVCPEHPSVFYELPMFPLHFLASPGLTLAELIAASIHLQPLPAELPAIYSWRHKGFGVHSLLYNLGINVHRHASSVCHLSCPVLFSLCCFV